MNHAVDKNESLIYLVPCGAQLPRKLMKTETRSLWSGKSLIEDDGNGQVNIFLFKRGNGNRTGKESEG